MFDLTKLAGKSKFSVANQNFSKGRGRMFIKRGMFFKTSDNILWRLAYNSVYNIKMLNYEKSL